MDLSGYYRYGFNGKEKDNETYGENNAYDFGARIYDPRLGRWMSVDPLHAKYPDLSPFNYTANNPIYYIDPDGQRIVVHYEDEQGNNKTVVIRKASDIEKLNYTGAGKFAANMYKTLQYMKDDEEFTKSARKLSRVHVIENQGGDTRYISGRWEEGVKSWHTILYDPAPQHL